MTYKRHKIFVETFAESVDPPWVCVATTPSFEDVDRTDQLNGALVDDQLDFIRSLPKWREAQRFIRDVTQQVVALSDTDLDASGRKTATATIAGLESLAADDLVLSKSVLAIKNRTKVDRRKVALINAAGYVVSAGGDFAACGVDMSGEAMEWIAKLRPADVAGISSAATDFAGLSEGERQDLLTPRQRSLATPRQSPQDSADSSESPLGGSDYTTITALADSGKAVA